MIQLELGCLAGNQEDLDNLLILIRSKGRGRGGRRSLPLHG